MATTYRFPVILWEDHAGLYTGRLLDEDQDGVAVGATRSDVLRQLSSYIAHLHEDDKHWFSPDFLKPKLRKLTFKLFPEYQEGETTYASKDAVELRLPCVTGERESGHFTALLPTIDVAFEYHDQRSLTKLAAHYVRAEAKGKTPQELSRFLPPPVIALDEIVVSLREAKRSFFDEADIETLTKIADPLVQRDRSRITRVWEREDEIRNLAQWLSQDDGHLCLVGEPGCGKTAILAEAARQVEASLPVPGDFKTGMRPSRFWHSNGARIIAGMAYLGQWEERLEAALHELAQLRGILCLSNLLELLQVGGSGPEASIGAFILPLLQEGGIRLVVEATSSEMDACDRLLPGLVDLFRVIQVETLDDDAAERLLAKGCDHLADRHQLECDAGVSQSTHSLFRRFQPYAAFPGKALDFLNKAAEHAKQQRRNALDSAWIQEEFGRATGLPTAFLSDAVPYDADTYAESLSRRILGQPEAIRSMVACLTRFKAGLHDPNRPLGVYLFAGPTGVGKTALVRAMGDLLFENLPESERIVRLDMSEYASFDASARLLGDPYGKPSELIRRIRAQPFTVLLFDEIEKASEEVFDVLLNVFEEGRLTDALGRVTSFQSALIVMTSNLGAEGRQTIRFEADSAGTDRDAIKRFFRPEFFNRLDEVLYFAPLEHTIIREITRKEIAELAEREGLHDREITLHADEALIDALSAAGFDPKLGARPLQRTIEEVVTAALAHYLLANTGLHQVSLRLSWSDGHVRIEQDAEWVPLG